MKSGRGGKESREGKREKEHQKKWNRTGRGMVGRDRKKMRKR